MQQDILVSIKMWPCKILKKVRVVADVLKLRLSFRTGIYYTFMFLKSLYFVKKIHSFGNKCIVIICRLVVRPFLLLYMVRTFYFVYGISPPPKKKKNDQQLFFLPVSRQHPDSCFLMWRDTQELQQLTSLIWKDTWLSRTRWGLYRGEKEAMTCVLNLVSLFLSPIFPPKLTASHATVFRSPAHSWRHFA